MKKLEFSSSCELWEKAKAKALLSTTLLFEARRIDTTLKDPRAASLVEKAAALHVDWHALVLQGQLRRATGKFVEAAEAFQEAIDLIAYSDDEASSNQPSHAGAWKNEASKLERANLAAEADEAKHLAAAGPNGTLVASSDRDGNPGGVLSSAVDRGAVGIQVPAPVLFQFNSAELTRVGNDAAQQMADFLKQRSPKAIKVVGHTDRVGGEAYNLELSKRRAATVARFLKDNGITAHIDTDGKGFSEPRKMSKGAAYSQEQINELNRRVEFDWK
ncbi:OmpA family protein [Rhodopseudomonas palustris]|uniref:OmpA family protein n=1 Tax=Rhodopseudomonas palustris TaxID=1076 RepID=UPI0021F2D4B0|nr:OmpA family protein [Rhodopseudomonas palustris]UYO54605.1 OmpA family protein [Rhodopseudomonas palustris]